MARRPLLKRKPRKAPAAKNGEGQDLVRAYVAFCLVLCLLAGGAAAWLSWRAEQAAQRFERERTLFNGALTRKVEEIRAVRRVRLEETGVPTLADNENRVKGIIFETAKSVGLGASPRLDPLRPRTDSRAGHVEEGINARWSGERRENVALFIWKLQRTYPFLGVADLSLRRTRGAAPDLWDADLKIVYRTPLAKRD